MLRRVPTLGEDPAATTPRNRPLLLLPSQGAELRICLSCCWWPRWGKRLWWLGIRWRAARGCFVRQVHRPRARRTRLEGTLGPLETDLRLIRGCLHQFKYLVEGGLARTLQRRAILDYPIRWGGWASSGWNP